MRVLALTPYPQDRVPGQRFRIEQWADGLANHGIEIVFSPFISSGAMDVLYRPGHLSRKLVETLKGYAHRIGELMRARPADAIFVFREAALLGPALIERLLSWRRPIVFDFDDAIYLRDTSQANAWVSRLKSRSKPSEICRLARHVMVGNEFLAAFARQHARAVTVVPTSIDTDVYCLAPRPRNERPVVGWTGSATTVAYLEALAPALTRLRAIHGFDLRVVGGDVTIERVSVRATPWRASTEVEDIRSMDIGLMPLADDEWSRGKCGLKALQYMALGIPPVVSPVGVNETIVRDGVNGFHARTEAEWVDRIGLLLQDETLRARLGEAARQTVEKEYSARVQVPRVAAVFRQAVSG